MKQLFALMYLLPFLPASSFLYSEGIIIPDNTIMSMPSYAHNMPVRLEAPLLNMADGNPRFIKMAEMISLKKKVRNILDLKLPSTKHPNRTFKSIIAHEAEFSAQERDAVLKKFITQFVHMMPSVFDDLRLIKEEVIKIIESWSEKRHRSQTKLYVFLTDEYHTDPVRTLQQRITTLADFDTFLEDADLFFYDLITNLPKSYAKYLEAIKQ